MTLALAYRRTTYLLASIGFLSLLITEELSWGFALAFLLTLILSYGNDTRAHPIALPSWFWNIITVAFFFYEVFQYLVSDRELIIQVAEFLVVLQIVRLWVRKGDRDHLQIFGLSLLHLIAAAVLTASLSFSLIFLLYIVAGTWALIVFNLQRELGKQNQRNQAQQQLVTPKFLGVLSLVALGVFLFSIILFLFFPRLNYNYFATFLKNATPQSGFSEQVRLGQIGAIKLNSKMVMRVTLSGSEASKIRADQLYFAGVVLTQYDGRNWRVSPTHSREMVVVQGNTMVPIAKRKLSQANLTQEILLEPMGNDVLFAIPKVLGVKTPFGVVSHLSGDNLLGSFSGGQRVKYTIYSDVTMTSVSKMRSVRETPVAQEFEEYLQLPDDFNPRIAELARSISGRQNNLYDKAKAMETHLRTQFAYALEMMDPGDEDPLSFFLFKRRAGHCEYFASAYAVMLRALGIPTRLVNGYHHGEWNRLGNFYLIRESHAHTWVEVYLPESGWVRFDPTPADPTLNEAPGIFGTVRQLIDSAQLAWVQWVVDYSIHDQRNAATQVYYSGKKVNKGTKKAAFDARQYFRRYMSGFEIYFGLFFGIAVGFGLFLYFRQSGWTRKNRPKGERIRFYEQMLQVLRKQGFTRAQEQTPLEFSRMVQTKRSGPAQGIISELTELFCKIRYGNLTLDPSTQNKVDQLLKELKQSFKEVSSPSDHS